MGVVSFPDDLEFDQQATVIDRNVIYQCDVSSLLQEPTYVSVLMLRGLDRTFSQALAKIGRKKKRKKIPEVLGPSRIRALQKVLKNFNGVKNGVCGSELKNALSYCSHFITGSGYVVNPRTLEDPIGVRMAFYREKLQHYQDLVPKAFLKNHLGQAWGQLKRDYMGFLKEMDPQGRLMGRERDKLFEHLLAFYENDKSQGGLDEDIDLVALAAAAPAKRVSIWSNDTDVHTLTTFARRFLPLENVVQSHYAPRVR